MRDAYQLSMRRWSGPQTFGPRRVVLTDGSVLVDRAECDRWSEDAALREQARAAGLAAGNRLFGVTTSGGFIVDVWQVDHWQSGLESAVRS